MHPIKITSTHRNTTKVIHWGELPQSWNEVHSSSYSFIGKCIAYCQDEDQARMLVLRKLLNISSKNFSLLNEDVLYDLLCCLDWMNFNSMRIQLFEKVKRNYSLPSSDFKNGTCYEYAKADFYFLKYNQSKSQLDLDMFFASLLRFKLISSYTPLDVEKRLQVAKKTSQRIKIVTTLYFANVKEYVFKLFGEYLFSSSGGENKNESNLGWWGVYFSVAESGVFGDLSSVYRSSFYDVCSYLKQKKIQEINSKSKSDTNE